MKNENLEELEPTTGEIKAKTVSLVSKILGGCVLLGGFILKSLNVLNCETDDLLKVSFALVGLCGTIDVNILVDKFTKKNNE